MVDLIKIFIKKSVSTESIKVWEPGCRFLNKIVERIFVKIYMSIRVLLILLDPFDHLCGSYECLTK